LAAGACCFYKQLLNRAQCHNRFSTDAMHPQRQVTPEEIQGRHQAEARKED